ncbi:MAG: hypothetical protein ABSF98_18645 [Bryobacteraceae bacterium]
MPDEILHDHNVAGLSYREIGFGSDNQAERLQLGCGIQLAVVAIQEHFAHVRGATLGGDGPHHIGQVLGTEHGGGLQLLHARVDFDHALFALHPGLAAGFRQERCAAEIDVRRSAAVIVVNCGCRPGYHSDAIDRHGAGGRRGRNFG